MLSLNVKLRTSKGRGTDKLRGAGIAPAVVYGPGEKNLSLEVNEKEFLKVFKEAGESSLIELCVEGEKPFDKAQGGKPVLVHEIQKDPVSGKPIHIDFFQASLKEEVEVAVPLVFEGVSFAVKDLGANLVKNMTEIEVKALPQNLPHQIAVDLSLLKEIGNHILVKDLKVPSNVTILKKPEEIVAAATEVEKVEEELAKTVEEDVTKVEKVEKEKKVEDVVEEVKEDKK